MVGQGREAVERIHKHFGMLKDPRVERTRLHPLVNVLVIALCGVMAGADGWKGLSLLGKARAEWFATFLDMSNGVPSADTFRRVFSALKPEALEACFRSWVRELTETLKGEVVAVDGKSVRGALGRALAGTPLHLVHVWATGQKLLLAQTAVQGAPGEVGAIEELLKWVELRGAAVTVDVNGCTPKVARFEKFISRRRLSSAPLLNPEKPQRDSQHYRLSSHIHRQRRRHGVCRPVPLP